MKIREKGAVSSDPEHIALYSQVPVALTYTYNPDALKDIYKTVKGYPNLANLKLYYQMVGRDGDFIIGGDVGNFDYRFNLKDLNMPVLIYTGRFDRVALPWIAVKFQEYCPQAKFVMFEKSGHFTQLEEPEKLFNTINAFLAK